MVRDFVVMLLLVGVSTFVSASLSFYLIERPALRFKDPRRSGARS
jgi:peptidoglycan/LPS O-acetylase OafA/YrhL